MKKNTKNDKLNQGILQFPALNPEINTEEAFYDLVYTLGLNSFLEIIKDEITELCGPRYQNQPQRVYTRWSKKYSEVIFGGRKIKVFHKRIRDLQKKKDITLESIRSAKNIDLLHERQFENMVIGVSTRKYKRSLEGQAKTVEGYGITKSSVSRGFIAKTQASLTKWLHSPITISYPIIMIDGIEFKKRTIVIALGIDINGQKKPLGMIAGSTENSRICIDLLNNLEERGLNVEAIQLAVIDGSKALHKALVDKLNKNAVIQRCQEHKIRNVLSYLPDEKKEIIRFSIREAYQMKDYKSAHKQLSGIIRNIESEYPSAANSLREGLEETLTMHKYNVPLSIRKSLRSTNSIENLMGRIRDVSKRVKRWRNVNMILRWVYTGVYESEKSFQKINGYKKIAIMLENIKNYDKKEVKIA